jgi:flagellar motor switch protein FliG
MSAEGVVRSAILMMALGKDEAAEVFKHLGPREVQKVGVAMARLERLSKEEITEVIESFLEEASRQTGLGIDSDSYLRSVLTTALGDEKGAQLIDRILQGDDTRGIEGLKWMDSEAVAELIKNEHPQIIATVLVHLDRDQACEVASFFPERQRNDVMLRIATLDGIQPTALRELDDVLKNLLSGGDLKRAPMGGARAAAEILNYMKSEHEKGVLETVRSYDEDLAAEIIDLMFTFDNLMDLDNVAIQQIVKEVNTDTLIIALKGANQALRTKFLSNMSRRAAELFAEDLEARGPVRVSEVEEKQREILQVVRTLAENGQIVVGKNQEDAYIS